MRESLFLAFDFGFKRIGVAVGQALTATASPLRVLKAKHGNPDWNALDTLVSTWSPKALIVGLPTKIDGGNLYTTRAARSFAKQLETRFNIAVHLVDERLTTVEAKSHLFDAGGYRNIQKTQVDCLAACLILEQWFSSNLSTL